MIGGFDVNTGMAPMPTVDPVNFPTPTKSGGMFGGGGFDWRSGIAAALAGLVSRRNPQLAQMMMLPMQLKQKQAMEEAQYQRHRQDELTDYEAKRKIEIQNPLPQMPTEYERALQAAGIMPGTPEYQQHMNNYVQMRENPVFPYTDPATGAMMLGTKGIQSPEIIQSLPPGAKPIGGPSPSGSGGFRGAQ